MEDTMECLECKQKCEKEWYIPTSYGGIYPLCSEECANIHSDKLIIQGKLIKSSNWTQISPHEFVIDTGTNES